jgi:hypothetical protein
MTFGTTYVLLWLLNKLLRGQKHILLHVEENVSSGCVFIDISYQRCFVGL